jgi:hypothetical protein
MGGNFFQGGVPAGQVPHGVFQEGFEVSLCFRPRNAKCRGVSTGGNTIPQVHGSYLKLHDGQLAHVTAEPAERTAAGTKQRRFIFIKTHPTHAGGGISSKGNRVSAGGAQATNESLGRNG